MSALERLHADLQEFFAQSDVKAAITRTGMVPKEGASIQDLQAFIRAEIERWGKVVQQAGIAGSM
jgi:tripartite-type tricarboxylate transporter receptor subunit TctC